MTGAVIAERRQVAKVVAGGLRRRGYGMPDPLFTGFPDGTGKAEESDTIVEERSSKSSRVATDNTSTWGPARLTD